MRQALFIPNFGTFCDPSLVADLAARAEAAGWDGFFLWDHVVHRNGDEPTVDPWITLAAVAIRTSQIRIGPMITPIPRRRPWNVARQAATLDHLSNGRVVLGVGLGTWGTPEFSGFSEQEDRVERAAMLDEGLEVIEELWTGEVVHHSGPHYRVDGVRFLPVPVQRPIPIWVAGEWPNRRPMRRAARFQGVFPIRLPGPGALAEVFAIVGEGKDVAVEGGEYPVSAWEEAGATWVLRTIRSGEPRSQVEEVIDAGPGQG
jgi:alkanesulfonate monooxygenase SsuD/methylene tetrahydromethanopterin reductase-like flavin-dependent oxidoreductase (luciferase family)